jgi:site-specific DNA-methyltransferase (adenine-specific)
MLPESKGIIKSMKPFDDIPHTTIEKVTIYNCDCLDLLKRFPYHYFNLSQVDPPYGMGGRWVSKENVGFTLKPDEIGEINKWDKPPEKKYFDELKRVSQNYLVWGGNYFIKYLGDLNSIIIWDKQIRGFTLADGECCWTSYLNRPLRIINCGQSIRFADKKSAGGRTHPTQKPIYLYRKTLEMYAKPGYRILDTHLGSGTHAIACLMMGFELVACEISAKYYNDAIQKIREWQASHQEIFDKEESPPVLLKEGGMF